MAGWRTLFLLVSAMVACLSCTARPVVALADNIKPGDPLRTDNFGPVYSLPENPTDCSSLVVMLHGLGDTGEGWRSVFGEFYLARGGVCVLLPTARRMHVKAAKQALNAWFDVSDARFRDVRQEVDVDEVRLSAEHIVRLTRQAMTRFAVPWSRVVICGFSMGAALAVYTGMTAPSPPAGIVAIGGFLAAQSHLLGLAAMGRAHRAVPMLFLHGDADRVVPVMHAKHAVESLRKVGASKVELVTSPTMEHGLDDDMFARMSKWIDGVLADADAGDGGDV